MLLTGQAFFCTPVVGPVNTAGVDCPALRAVSVVSVRLPQVGDQVVEVGGAQQIGVPPLTNT